MYITLEEAKSHLRVDFDDDDTYIEGLCDMVEALVLNEIKGSVTGEGTVTTAGTTSLTGSDTDFTDFNVGDSILVAGESGRIIATITDDENLTVTVAFVTSADSKTYKIHTGFPLENGDLPLQLRQAMLLMIGHFYMIREPVIVGVSVNKIPYGFDFLIAPFKNYTIV